MVNNVWYANRYHINDQKNLSICFKNKLIRVIKMSLFMNLARNTYNNPLLKNGNTLLSSVAISRIILHKCF